jgi:hypothetical protein
MRIGDVQITSAKIGTFDPEKLNPVAKAQWRALGERLGRLKEFQAAHPVLTRLAKVPFVGSIYRRKMFAHVGII